MAKPRGKFRALATVPVTALAAAALAAAALSSGAAQAAAAPKPAVVFHKISPMALGLNTAPWDYLYAANASAGGGVDVMQPLLRSAGIDLLKFGGGSYADFYDWQYNSNIQNCLPYDSTASFKVTSKGCAAYDPLAYDQFATQTKAIGARNFVTVNYGSGTPAEAAAWVAHSLSRPRDNVALWEVGNETYGCWEVNNELIKPPASYHGYTPNTYETVNGKYENPTCPQVTLGNKKGTQLLASSYAAHALPFLKAMHKADPKADLGVPWAFPTNVKGAAVPLHAEWDNTVLRADGKYIGFVDAHFYPFNLRGSTGGANPTDQAVLKSIMMVPSLDAQIKSELRPFDQKAGVVVGETGVSPGVTTTVCTPTGALFAAGDVLAWLAAGAETVDWWDMNGGGNTTTACANADVGMFTSSSPPVPETPYYGYLLASRVARPGAQLATMATSRPGTVLAYQSKLKGGGEALAFINTNTQAKQTVTFHPQARLRGLLTTLTYSAGQQNLTNSNIVTGSRWASAFSHGITLPAESMVILIAG